MTHAFKFANRYNAPDNDLPKEIAEASRRQAGERRCSPRAPARSSTSSARPSQQWQDGRRRRAVVQLRLLARVERRGDAITLPLTADYRQDIPALINAVKKHYRSVGFVYLCNPNNPTGRIVTKQEIRQLLDGIPEDVPVLIDEAYHHFVEDPNYAHLGAVRHRGAAGHRHADLLEDRGARRHAARLRDRVAGDHREAHALHQRLDQRGGEVGRRRGAQGHRGAGAR